MTAISTKGIVIELLNGSASGDALDISAISAANPPVIDLTTPLGAAPNVGDVVVFGSNTGFEELNGKSFLVGSDVTPTASQFSLAGIDLSSSTGAVGGSITATLYGSADFVSLCLSQLDIGESTTQSISTATFCDTASSVGGNPQLGNITIGGYVDPNDSGYQEVLAAEMDGANRVFKVRFPQDYGYLVGIVTVGSVSWQAPLEGGIAWTATMNQNTQIRYVNP